MLWICSLKSLYFDLTLSLLLPAFSLTDKYLISNGSFEEGISGWYNDHSAAQATFEYSNEYSYDGSYSFKVTMSNTQAWPRYNYTLDIINDHILYISVRSFTEVSNLLARSFAVYRLPLCRAINNPILI